MNLNKTSIQIYTKAQWFYTISSINIQVDKMAESSTFFLIAKIWIALLQLCCCYKFHDHYPKVDKTHSFVETIFPNVTKPFVLTRFEVISEALCIPKNKTLTLHLLNYWILLKTLC